MGEFIAKFGLVAIALSSAVLASLKVRASVVPMAAGLYIPAAYWLTSFANPAVTIAHGFSNIFAGIHPANEATFFMAQPVAAGPTTGFSGLLPVDATTPKGMSI